jgi:uncharacterized damage-inducible protein DinB
MTHQPYCLNELNSSEEFFNRSTRVFQEEHSAYRPVESQYTVATQMAHVAKTVEWFAEGTFSPTGFDMDFEAHISEVMACTSIAAAREWVARAFNHARALVSSKTEAELAEMFPEGGILSGPKWGFVSGVVDHTAHHRGSLAVYARLLGLNPPMPYMDIPDQA